MSMGGAFSVPFILSCLPCIVPGMQIVPSVMNNSLFTCVQHAHIRFVSTVSRAFFQMPWNILQDFRSIIWLCLYHGWECRDSLNSYFSKTLRYSDRSIRSSLFLLIVCFIWLSNHMVCEVALFLEHSDTHTQLLVSSTLFYNFCCFLIDVSIGVGDGGRPAFW